jgi:hypothetical protein
MEAPFLLFAKYYWDKKTKCGQSEACVGERRNKRKIYAKNLKERNCFEDLDRDRRIIVQRVSH